MGSTRNTTTIDSGLIDLDALLRQMAESERALPVAAKAVVAPEPVAPPLPVAPSPPDSLEAVAVSAPVSEVRPAPRAVAEPVRVAVEAPRRSRRSLAVPAVALVAAAAAFLLVRPSAAPPPSAVTVAAPAPRAEVTSLPETAPIAVTPPAEVATTTAKAPEPVRAPSVVAARVAEPRPAPRAEEPVVVPAPAGDLGAAMRSAVGPRDEVVTTAGEVGAAAGQVRPSQGAVVGAIGAVLPAARACLGPDDPIRSATVVFRSDGSVARIDAKNDKPSDTCIREALAKARVAPFVDDTFATRVTVRP